jgi:hypothetical protein
MAEDSPTVVVRDWTKEEEGERTTRRYDEALRYGERALGLREQALGSRGQRHRGVAR